MLHSGRTVSLIVAIAVTVPACTPEEQMSGPWKPVAVVDLGALVTDDLSERVLGKAFVNTMWAPLGLDRPNRFEVIRWDFQMPGGSVSGQNSYYTVQSHGGPHVDAPNHIGVGGGVDTYPIEAFAGPVRVFDARDFPPGRSVPVDVFEDSVNVGDVVLIYTGFARPESDEVVAQSTTLTYDAAEFLATLPIRAFGTDAPSVASFEEGEPTVEAPSETARAVPIHHAFLSRSIPVYEQLQNVGELFGHERMFFVGVPLNIRNGDAMIVRPVVFVY